MSNAELTSRLKTLVAIECELKRIGEWKSTRSSDLEWHLSLEEYLQFITIPTMRLDLERGENVQWSDSVRPSIETDWHRSFRFKKVAELILTDQGLPPVVFCSPLSSEECSLLKNSFDQLSSSLESLKSNFSTKETELHEAFLLRLNLHLSHHRKHLEQMEPPAALPKDLLLYFDVVDEVPEAVSINAAMKSYQTLLESNADNLRIASAEKDSKLEIEIVISQDEIAEKFTDAYRKIGQSMKLKGFKAGAAPIESIRKDPSVEKRAKDLLRDPLMNEAFEKYWIKYLRTSNEDRPPYALLQPLCRLSENSAFKFTATLDRRR